MPGKAKTILLFIITAIAYVTIGKAPGIIPGRNRDLETSIAMNIVVEGRDV
jgi:hypothetical protein